SLLALGFAEVPKTNLSPSAPRPSFYNVADSGIDLTTQAPRSGLNILNPEFTPNGTRVLQNLTNQQNALLTSDLSRASGFLSKAEIDAALNPGIARAQYG